MTVALRKGWFKIPGVQDGDRTLDEQMKGLGQLVDSVHGQAVLDLGCAEGLIARRLLDAGADRVVGVEIVKAHVEQARAQLSGYGSRAVFYEHNLNDASLLAQLPGPFDTVLLLALLHKLHRPEKLLAAVAALAPYQIIIRTAAATPGRVHDARSDHRVLDIVRFLGKHSYVPAQITKGHFDEWMGYFTRVRLLGSTK